MLNGTALVVFTVATLTPAFAHSYGPAARVSGAPGDAAAACTSCHAGTLNSGGGRVEIALQSGPIYIPGVKQRITVQISDPVQQRWGFELTARLNSDLQNGQAGEFVPVDNFTQVVCEDNAPLPCPTGVSFVQQTSAGTRNGTKGGATFQFDWNPPSKDAGPVTLYVAGNAANGNGTSAGDLIYTSTVQLQPVIPAAPVVSAGNIVSAATFAPGPLAPYSWVTVYGSNLGATTRSWRESDFINGAMPVSLDGVSVILTAFGAPRRASVGFVSPTQVNFLLPSDTNATTVQVQVRNPAGISAQLPITVQANAPQLLTLDGRYAFATHADGGIIGKAGLLGSTPLSPAAPAETIRLYCTGCGPTNPPLVPSQLATQALPVATLPRVTIGGANANVASATALPDNPGVYSVVVQVPSDGAPGDQAVIIQLGTFSSASTQITIQK